jgi:hypothetical protein
MIKLDKRAKLALVVFNKHIPKFRAGYKGVQSTDRNISDPDLSVLAAADFDAASSSEVDDVNGLGVGVGDGLDDHVGAGVGVDVILEECDLLAGLEEGRVGVGVLADFALELLPDVGVDEGRLLHVLLALEPLADALQVDVRQRACALAGRDQRVPHLVFTQTDPAHRLLWLHFFQL